MTLFTLDQVCSFRRYLHGQLPVAATGVDRRHRSYMSRREGVDVPPKGVNQAVVHLRYGQDIATLSKLPIHFFVRTHSSKEQGKNSNDLLLAFSAAYLQSGVVVLERTLHLVVDTYPVNS